MIQEQKYCRLCGTVLPAEPVLRLKPTPIANAFEAEARKHISPAVYPLDLYLCPNCAHLQLGHVIDAQTLFGDYAYVSPPGMRPHWKAHAEAMVKRFGLKPKDLVAEIGSNSGDCLREYQERGMRVLGFEPAKEIAAAASAKGIPTRNEFFNGQTVIDEDESET